MLRRIIERPIAVTMSLIIVLILGFVGIGLIPVSLIPAVDIPYISVQVNYPSNSAREIDNAVIQPLRNQLLQLSGLEDIRTESKDGSGNITISFRHGVNTDFLFIEANEKIDRIIGSLPADMERPMVFKATATDIPAFYLNISVKGEPENVVSDPLFPVSDKFAYLSDFARFVISKRIEQLPEVAMVDLNGFVLPEIMIIPDREKLRQLDISLPFFEKAIRGANINMGTLVVRDGEYQYDIKLQNNALGKEDIENVYLKVAGSLFRVSDLATVIQHSQQRNTIVKSDGQDAVSLAIIKQSEARMSDLKEHIGELMSDFETEYPDLNFSITRDQTELLEYSINNLIQNIILGVLLTSIVILVFMRNLRSALIVVITIPVALIFAMLVFYIIGLSINIVSLSGLILGVGMMVDNSIILIDNIFFRWRGGLPLKEAVIEGTKEVFSPMLSSVLTTCAVFIPLIFMSGIAGTLFYDQAMAVTITLFCSLFVTVTLLPVYFYLFYRNTQGSPSEVSAKRLSGRKAVAAYERTLKYLLRHRWIMWAGFCASIVGVVLLFGAVGRERLPEITYEDILLNIEWNERVTVEENYCRTALVMDHIGPMVSQTTVMSGLQQSVLSHTRSTGISEAVVYIKSNGEFKIGQIEKAVNDYMLANYPEAVFSFEASGNIFDMVFGEKEARLVARVRPSKASDIDPATLERFITDVSLGMSGLDVTPIKWQKKKLFVAQPEIMALYDISYPELVSSLKSAINDDLLFTILQGHVSLPVVIAGKNNNMADILNNAAITKNGTDIPIGNLLKETMDIDFKYITSGPEGNYYPLELELDDKDIPAAIGEIKAIAERYDDLEVSFSGAYFSNRNMVNELIVILVVAILLLYFILGSQFESLVQPLIILSELVIDIFAILLALWMLGITLNIMSLIGIIITCGIVINDSILKIDAINRLRRSGHSLLRSVIVVGQRKLKPIIMTSLTTILAVSPFLSRGSMGSDLQYPLSVVVIAGMTIGTLVSIFFIPLAYYVIYNKKK